MRHLITSVAILGLVSGGALAEPTAKAPAKPPADGGSSSTPSGTHVAGNASVGHPATTMPSGNNAGKSSHGNADGEHSGKGSGSNSGANIGNGSAVSTSAGSKPVSAPSSGASDPDLNPVFPPNHVPLAGIHRGHTPVGDSLVKKTLRGTPAPSTIATTTKSTTKPGSTPHQGPMAAAEASSTKTALKSRTASVADGESPSNKKAFQPPARPMVDAESVALHKMSGPEGKLEPVVKESEPAVAKAPQPPKPVASVPPRSTLNGTSTSLQHGQPLPLSGLGGIQNSKTVKHTASINGSTFR